MKKPKAKKRKWLAWAVVEPDGHPCIHWERKHARLSAQIYTAACKRKFRAIRIEMREI